jgi:hypothetical protein
VAADDVVHIVRCEETARAAKVAEDAGLDLSYWRNDHTNRAHRCESLNHELSWRSHAGLYDYMDIIHKLENEQQGPDVEVLISKLLI